MSRRRIASAPKSRAGCATCKRRHVKCDETRPVCHRCYRGGFKCNGFLEPQAVVCDPGTDRNSPNDEPHRVATATGPNVPPTLSLDNANPASDRRALHFFRTQTIPLLIGYWDNDVLSRQLLIAESYLPLLHHAILACSYCHELAIDVDKRNNLLTDYLRSSATQQYIKAIGLFRATIEAGKQNVVMLRAVPLLFVLFEFLMGRSREMVFHTRSGIRLFKGREAEQSPSEADLQLEAVFDRLSLNQLLYGRPRNSQLFRLPDSIPLKIVPGRFSTIEEARSAACAMFVSTLRMVRIQEARSFPSVQLAQQLQMALKQRLHDWRAAFESYCEFSPTIDSRKLRGRDLILAQYYMAKIFLYCSIGQREVAFDRHLSDFESMLRLIGRTLTHDVQDVATGSVAFSFDLGIIPLLFFTALKCRHPLLRRQSIAMLGITPCREGLWNAREAAKVASHVMKYEESRAFVEMGRVFIPEHGRVHDVDIEEDESNVNAIRTPRLRFKTTSLEETHCWDTASTTICSERVGP